MAGPSIFDKLHGWLPLLPLLLVLLGSYWLNLQVQPLPTPDTTQRHDVDYVAEGLHATALTPQGTPHFILSAAKLWHFPDDDSTHLQQAHLIRFFDDRPPTEIKAQRGMLASRGEEVFLQDAVEGVQRSGDAARERRFETESLHVQPDRGWAETAQPVRLFDRHNTIDAVGMELDENAQTIKLLSHVRGIHEPVRP